jgi:ribosomal-protein-alanine N-acetyltransferase
MSSFGLSHEGVVVRPLRKTDSAELARLILGNRSWLRPWEATNPYGANSFDIKAMIRGLLRQMKAGQGLPMIIEVDGQMAGQLNVANILYGSVSGAMIGYWVAPEFAGRGVTPTAVALVSDYLFNVLGLHRVQIDIRPENAASLRVVEKLGFRYEGTKLGYIHINGDWRDHYSFAMLSNEATGGLLRRFVEGNVAAVSYPFRATDI